MTDWLTFASFIGIAINIWMDTPGGEGTPPFDLGILDAQGNFILDAQGNFILDAQGN